MSTPPRETWEETAAGVVREVFGRMNPTDDQQNVLREAILGLAAVHGQYTRSALVDIAEKIRQVTVLTAIAG